tara:strand:- start:1501 stop:2265 length:765 start_codon:yes stop_codon:yes gene_type:complete
MNIENWTKKHFTETSKFNWNCPHCKSKSLEFLKDKFVTEETQESRNYRLKDDDWEVEWITLNVSGQLKCKNCEELVFFLGIGNPQENGYYDQHLDDFVSEYETYFSPTFVNPTIHLFEIPEVCPELVTDEIIASFKLYWCDLESCANKIRTSLERLMDEFKVKKYSIKNGKRTPIALHHRIEKFPKREITNILLAIKWIGNTGTHRSKNLETIDIVETYSLLEYALNKLYKDTEKEIKKIAKEINSRKGKRKRK